MGVPPLDAHSYLPTLVTVRADGVRHAFIDFRKFLYEESVASDE